MTYKILHARNGNFFVDIIPKSEFIHVGTIEAANLDDAYAKTQNINSNWTTEKYVVSCMGKCRSTSPGDVIIDEWNKTTHMVENYGFSELNEDFERKK